MESVEPPALAESWAVSPDGLTYEFVLRRGVKFHNGEPVTAEDAHVLVRALSRLSEQDPQRENRRGLITGYSFSAPYEDVRLKGK